METGQPRYNFGARARTRLARPTPPETAMKRLALTLLLGLSAFAVQAQTAPAEEAAPVAVAEETTVITPADTAKPVRDNGCVRETGTKLKRRDANGCVGVPGQSYSRADIDATGAIDTADAVRKLSPRANVSRGH